MRPFRPDKLASVIRNTVGEAIAHNLQDPRVSAMTSVTRVEVSGDLQHAKVYISVMGSETVQSRTLMGLNHARAHIQRILAGRITARQCPRIRFVADDSIKRSARIVQIIKDSLEGDRRAPDGEIGADSFGEIEAESSGDPDVEDTA